MTTSLVEHEPVGPAGSRVEHPAAAPASDSQVQASADPLGVDLGVDPVDRGELVERDLALEALEAGVDGDPALDDHRRTIKRYSNRKLYDTRQSRYVTLLQIAEMVRAGEDVQIIDNATKEDKTDVTLALIISEELKARPRAIPLATLKALIRHRGGKLLTQLRESPIGRLMPPRDETLGVEHAIGVEAPISETAMTAEDAQVSKEQPGALRRTIEQWQHTIDERIRTVVPHFGAIQELQGEIQQLARRLEELEKRLPPPRE
ncbi:MAG: hypothetical protein RL685_6706 [Pseudomonadota bacterium]